MFDRKILSNQERGFTLIELIVYVALLALVVVLVSQFVLGILRANISGGAQEEVVSSIEQATDAIDREARGAMAIYTPTSAFDVNPGQLSLITARHLPSGEQTTYIDFFLSDDSRICMRRETPVTQCFTSQKVQITDLRFARLVTSGGAEAVQTLITARYRSSQAALQTPFSVQTTTVVRGGE